MPDALADKFVNKHCALASSGAVALCQQGRQICPCPHAQVAVLLLNDADS